MLASEPTCGRCSGPITWVEVDWGAWWAHLELWSHAVVHEAYRDELADVEQPGIP